MAPIFRKVTDVKRQCVENVCAEFHDSRSRSMDGGGNSSFTDVVNCGCHCSYRNGCPHSCHYGCPHSCHYGCHHGCQQFLLFHVNSRTAAHTYKPTNPTSHEPVLHCCKLILYLQTCCYVQILMYLLIHLYFNTRFIDLQLLPEDDRCGSKHVAVVLNSLSKHKFNISVVWTVHCHFHNCPPLVTVLSQINPVNLLQTCSFRVRLSIIFPSSRRLSSALLPS
jgi:hypothetical protein